VRVEQKPSDAILRTLLMITAKAREKQPAKPLKRRQQTIDEIMAKFDGLQPRAGWEDGPMGAKVPPGYRLVRVKEEEEEEEEEEEPEGGEAGEAPDGGETGGGETPLLPPPRERDV
jgi:hypothetical protein